MIEQGDFLFDQGKVFGFSGLDPLAQYRHDLPTQLISSEEPGSYHVVSHA